MDQSHILDTISQASILRPFLFYYKISQLFFIDLGTLCALPVKYIPNTLLWFQQSLNAIEKPYSLQQSALVGDHNGRQILGLYHFVSEEFDYNIATYISS